MTPAYQAGNNEAGPGSHARRKAHIENHVDRIRGTMFASAIEPMTEVSRVHQSIALLAVPHAEACMPLAAGNTQTHHGCLCMLDSHICTRLSHARGMHRFVA
jgi:hypothetical protein